MSNSTDHRNYRSQRASPGSQGGGGLAFSLDDAVAILKRRRAWLVVGTLLGVALGLAALRLMVPTYTAKTAVLVRPSEMPKEFVRSAPVEPIRERLQTLGERLLSHDHLVETVRAVGQDRLDPDGELGLFGVVSHLRRQVEVEVGNSESPYASVFRVSYSASDPEVAADVVRILVDEFSTQSIRERIDEAVATVSFLDLELQSLGEKLAETESDLPADAAITPTKIRRGDPLRAELGRLNADLAGLLSRFTELHPEVNRKRREIAGLRKRLAARPAQNTGGTQPSAATSIASVPRDYERLVESYELLVARRVEAAIARNLAQTADQGDYQIIEPAVAPDKPSWPDPLLLIAGGSLAGLLGAIALAGLWEFRIRPFHSLGTLESRTGLRALVSVPSLGVLPSSELAKSPYREAVDPRVVAAHDPSGIAAEQFRRLGAIVVDDHKKVVVAVTSAVSGDGKSLTAANLAASIAIELDRRVLLVDADLHRPDLHKFYQVSSGLGLLDVLRGDGNQSGLVQKTAVPNLSILVAGSAGRDSLRYFVSTAWAGFLESARDSFDVVVVDCAPLLATVDSRFVARSADKRLLAVRRGQTPGDAAITALGELDSLEGIVFNDVEKHSLRHYYYYSERNFEKKVD